MAVKTTTRHGATTTQPQDRERCGARAVARRRHVTLYLMCSLEPGHETKHHDTYEQVSWDRTDERRAADTGAGA